MTQFSSEVEAAMQLDGRIALRGKRSLMWDLRYKFRGGKIHNDEDYDNTFITIPATRVNVMALEAFCTITKASDSYTKARAELMRPTIAEYERWAERRVDLDVPLLPHQEDFCAWAYDKRGVINASEQGTGKTIMSIALMAAWHKEYGYNRILVVAPKDPLRQWQGELYNTLKIEDCPLFIPLDNEPVMQRRLMMSSISKMDDQYTVIGINYEAFAAMKNEIKRAKFNLIIFDESWKFKTPTAQVTKAILEVTESQPMVWDYEKDEVDLARTSRVLDLNGTLFSNNVGDAWSQFASVTSKEQAGSYKHWMQDFSEQTTVPLPGGKGSVVKFHGIKDPVGLIQKFAPVYWRATKESCLDLPEKMPIEKIYLPMDEGLTDLYLRVVEDGESGLSSNVDWDNEHDETLLEDFKLTEEQLNNLSLAGAVTKALRLQQITSGFLPSRVTYGQPYIPPDDIEHHYNPDTQTYFLNSAKELWVADYLLNNLVNDKHKRIIIWCKFNTDVYRNGRLAKTILGEHAVREVRGGKGGINSRELNLVKESFNSRDPDGVRVLVAQMQRLSFGHNLQACDTNILYSHSWSYLQQDQLEDRSHRYGRIGPVEYKRLIMTLGTNGMTIDHRIVEALEQKELMANRLARDTTVMFK